MNIVTPVMERGIGDNRPPPHDPEVLRAEIAERHHALIARKESLIEAFADYPEEIDSDEAQGQVGDFANQLQKFIKTADKTREGEKAPFLEAGRTVDGFFKGLTTPLERIKAELGKRSKKYLDAKAAEEYRRRQVELQRQKEEAERAAQAAREAEAALQTEADLPQAIVAEQTAEIAQAGAAKAEIAVQAKPADMARTRGDYGSVSTLKREWVFADLDRATIDLETLRPHLPSAAIEQAIRSFIRAGGRKLTGCRIYEDTKAAFS